MAEDQKPFPYWPPVPPERELIRNELMTDLNKWDNNNASIAKMVAANLIAVLKEQFEIT